jgi:hypothetical protein
VIRKATIVLFTLTFILVDVSWGQCVMCKAVGEQSAKLDAVGKGLNAGIIFLMAFPYILLGIGGYVVWSRFNKQEQ